MSQHVGVLVITNSIFFVYYIPLSNHAVVPYHVQSTDQKTPLRALLYGIPRNTAPDDSKFHFAGLCHIVRRLVIPNRSFLHQLNGISRNATRKIGSKLSLLPSSSSRASISPQSFSDRKPGSVGRRREPKEHPGAPS